jgi:hypothetical protein
VLKDRQPLDVRSVADDDFLARLSVPELRSPGC